MNKYIVSVTSHSTRLEASAARACYSMIDQTFKPDKLVLWLGHQYKNSVPQTLLDLQQLGLEIRFTDDIGPSTKLLPSLKAFPDDYIITLDDDQYYSRDILERLITHHKQYPDRIVCNITRHILLGEDNKFVKVLPLNTVAPSHIWPQGVGGVLYPPHSLHNDVFNLDRLNNVCPTCDDIWFYGMGIIAGTKYVWTGVKDADVRKEISRDGMAGGIALWTINNAQHGNSGRQHFNKLAEYYPQIIEYYNTDQAKETITI